MFHSFFTQGLTKIKQLNRWQKFQIIAVVLLVILVVVMVRSVLVERERLRQAQYSAQVKLLTRATNYHEHLPKIEQAAAQDPKNRAAQMDLALAYYNVQEYEKAITAYEKIIKLDEDYTLAYNGLGNTYRDLAIATNDSAAKKDLFKKAEHYYREAIKWEKTYIIAYSNLAQMLGEYVDKTIAKMVVEEGLQQKADSPELQDLKKQFSRP